MESFTFNNTHFNIKDTLNCGQVFRFREFRQGYLVFSLNKCAYIYEDGEKVVVYCEKPDIDYFKRYFDLDRDYSLIYNEIISKSEKVICESAKFGKGIRILNQDKMEMIFSFIISQNNNIPRIKSIIEKLCDSVGEEFYFMGEKCYTFPSIEKISNCSLDLLKSFGLGYRAEYVYRLAQDFKNGFNLQTLDCLSTIRLKEELIKIHGVGRKVADCISLFGYHRSDSFPVDTWIEKVYREDLGGKLVDPVKISNELVAKYGENSGYVQQYLFYYKREKEKLKK